MVFLPEYAEEIHAFLRYKEDSTCPTPDYAGSAIQPELTWDMRQVLVNWLVQLHAHFNLAPESFYLAINVMDRFLGKRCVLVHNFHLVAVCSLMLAAKYEQHCAPPLKDLVAVCEDQYGIGVLRTAERYLLSKLNYDLAWPSPLTFMRRINEADGFDPRHRMLAKYLLELAQLDQRFVGCKPSILAAAAYLAACQILNLPWTEKHTRLAIYCADQLIPYVSVLLECCYMYQTSAVGEKYAQDAYYNIARTLPDYLDAAGFTYLGQRVMR
ncbi:cyclin-like protein [Powellomyces hirtus]|nr:cyclin-like protein [Powellomyces hirtus]